MQQTNKSLNTASLPLSAPERVQEMIRADFPQQLAALKKLVAFPGVSAHGFESQALKDTADWLEQSCKSAGFTRIERLRLPGSAPYLIATVKSARPKAPTVLIYAHYDVQPTGNEELWNSDPFKAVERQQRLYGRGTADDKVGIIATLAALEAFLKVMPATDLPVNLTLLLDGEEECGSPHIREFLQQHHPLLRSDYLLVPDLVNPSLDQPGIFFSLRGLVQFRVKISAMSKPLHSGLGGGVVPDPVAALAQAFARALGPKGEVRIPGIARHGGKIPLAMRRSLAVAEKAARLPKAFQLQEGCKVLQESPRKFFEALWFKPALGLLQMQVGEPDNYANRIESDISAVFSLRVAPGQNTKKVIRLLKNYFEKKMPYSCKAEFELLHEASGFFTDPHQKFFQTALGAVSDAYGKEALALGTGLTIPFVEFIQEHLNSPERPLRTILLGVEDIESNAHAENESVSLSMFESTIKAIANLWQRFGFSESA